MTTEIIQGLHSCKPENAPVIGETKTFVVENKVGKSGKPYLKIKSASTDNGGTPYRILEAQPTGFVDNYGNHSFNIGIEPATAFQQAKSEMTTGLPPQTQPQPAKQTQPYSMIDERQRAIIRQHSQSMAIEVLKLKVTLNELTPEDITPAKLTSLANYFDADVIGAATNE